MREEKYGSFVPVKCFGGEIVDTRDSKFRAKKRGGSNSLRDIILRIFNE